MIEGTAQRGNAGGLLHMGRGVERFGQIGIGNLASLYFRREDAPFTDH